VMVNARRQSGQLKRGLISGTALALRKTLLQPRDSDAAAIRRIRLSRGRHIRVLAGRTATLRMRLREKEKFIGRSPLLSDRHVCRIINEPEKIS